MRHPYQGCLILVGGIMISLYNAWKAKYYDALKIAGMDGIIDSGEFDAKIEVTLEEKYLSKHTSAISQTSDGRWVTHVRTLDNGRRTIIKNSREDLQHALIGFYIALEQSQAHPGSFPFAERVDPGARRGKYAKRTDYTLATLYPEWLEYYQLHAENNGTVSRTTYSWRNFYEHDPISQKPLNQLTEMYLDRWVHRLIKDHDMTHKAYYNATLPLRQMLIYARKSKYIQNNPFEEIHVSPKLFRKVRKKPDETQVYTPQEELAIVNEAWKDYQGNQKATTPLAIILMFYLGTRCGEIVALKDTDVSGRYLTISRMERRNYELGEDLRFHGNGRVIVDHAKTDAGMREIYLVNDAMAVIDLAVEHGRKHGLAEDFFLFRKDDGERITDNSIRRKLMLYCKRLGIPYRSSHKIRKTYISKLIDSGVNINTIRQLVGHEDERTTFHSYCFSRCTKDQTNLQLEESLKLTV